MSTFKKPPEYGSVILRALSSVKKGGGLSYMCVFEMVEWVFPGGTFGDVSLVKKDYDDQPVNVITSGTTLPGGYSADIADQLRQKVDRGVANPVPDAFMAILARRETDRRYRTSRRTAIDLQASLAYAASKSKNQRVRTGMAAVYALSHQLFDVATNPRTPASNRSVRLNELAIEMAMPSADGAHLSKAHFRRGVTDAVAMYQSVGGDVLTDVVSGVTALKMATMAGNTRRAFAPFREAWIEYLEEADRGREMESGWLHSVKEGIFEDVDTMPSSVMIAGVRVWALPNHALYVVRNQAYLLSRSDTHKVLQLMTGIRNAIVGACSELVSGPLIGRPADAKGVSYLVDNLRDTLECAITAPLGAEISVAKLTKAVVSVYKAEVAGILAAADGAVLLASLRADPDYTWMSRAVEGMLARSRRLTLKGALNSVKVFRLLPPPDVMTADALLERWATSAPQRDVLPGDLEVLKSELREVILTARIRAPGPKLALRGGVDRPAWWSHYVAGRMDEVPTAELAATLDWQGKIPIEKRDPIDPANWKDSGVGAATLGRAEDQAGERWESNMLQTLLFGPGKPNPGEWDVHAEMPANVFVKPESHKKRIVFSSSLNTRFMQSATEATVGDMMRNHPSYCIGISGDTRAQQEARMNDAAPSPTVVTMYFSFDIMGWSPNMPLATQVASHEVWDEVTGGTHFRETTRAMEGARAYCDTDGIWCWYENHGSNFEGYNGKEMTAVHIAVMSIAVKELRGEFPDVPAQMLRIMLQAYIDDGVARIDLMASRAEEIFEKWKQVVVRVWARYGFTVELKKSFPSDRYYEFLNESYYAGVHVAHGVRAAMRITADGFEVHESLPTRVSKLCSGARGAIVSGLYAANGLFLQSYFVSAELCDWLFVADPVKTAFWAHLPPVFGGLGLPGILQQQANAAGALIEENMSFLHAYALTNVVVADAYVKICRAPLRYRDSTDVLASPLGLESTLPRMASDLAKARAGERLLELHANRRLGPLASAMMEIADQRAHGDAASALLPIGAPRVVQEQQVYDVASALPQSIYRAFLSRFEKYSTIRTLVGQRAFTAIPSLNRADARRVYNAMMSYLA